eukprot:CAMPEP_0171059696 /NCGR_PEP_ID=MMETSP0766_2-20121228/3350_1 /TAXON_ID=439317 /ORGANISM="Gambierdiscus australes, Strain CAWD 149" /LENGTH=751 /DNA_ID=CAMNT_0011515175 /DNA_START=19 /DNA_END=2274 /DNA_ORIENTATION=-
MSTKNQLTSRLIDTNGRDDQVKNDELPGIEEEKTPDVSRSIFTRPELRRPSFLRQPLSSSTCRRSLLVGSQAHRLPFAVMWGITLLTAASMAVVNFFTIVAIEFSIRWKFQAMQAVMQHVGIGAGVGVLTTFSMAYALLGVCLIQFVAPSCGGSGLPENKCYLNGSAVPGFFTKRTLRVRVATTILANAAGYPVGREGPTVVIGSNVATLICQKIAKPYVEEKMDLSREKKKSRNAVMVDEERFDHATRIACSVGGACGMAMIFNAPFGGVLYMFEEVTSVAWPLELTFRVFVGTMFCAFTSYGMLNICGSDIKEFVIYAFVEENKEWHWVDIPNFIFVATLLGVLTSLHTRGMLYFAAVRGRVAKRLEAYQPWAKIIETVLYAALCALLSAFVSLSAECVSVGRSGLQYVRFNCDEGEYNPVASLLVNTSHSAVKLLFMGNNAGEIGFLSSMVAFWTYYSLNVGLTGLPVPGGAFTATMLLGGLFGRAIGALGRDLGLVATTSGVYAVVGSAAMLCGFKQMTLAVVLIVVECVNDLSLAPVVMLSVSVSMIINWSINRKGHDEEQIERKDLPFLEGDAPPHLDPVLARKLCDWLPKEAVLPPECVEVKVQQALNAVEKASVFPVVDPDTQVCMGIIKRQHLEDMVTAKSGKALKRRKSRAFTANPFATRDDAEVSKVNELIRANPSDMLPLYRLMDPTPFMVLEDMPAPRVYGLFSKAGERTACVVSREGKFRGVISRIGLIQAARHGVE